MATVSPPPQRPPLLNLPNQLTVGRLALGIVLFGLIELHYWPASIAVFAVAALTDWLDGYIARRHGLTSALGRNLDPLVDKVVVCGAYIFLLPIEGTGLAAWMVAVVVGRELLITGLRSYMEKLGTSFGADWLGKVKMGLQSAALFAVFAALLEPALFFVVTRNVLLYAMIAATAISGLQYLWRAGLLLTSDAREL